MRKLNTTRCARVRKNRCAVTAIAWAIVILSVLFVMPGIMGFYENHYWRDGVISNVTGNAVTVCDSTGEEWIYYADSDGSYKIGDEVRLRMSTNYTDRTIYDDEVESVTVVK